MDKRAIEKAKSRLRTAKNALDNLGVSKSYQDFYDHWYVFLTSIKNIYTVLEQGAKTSPQSRQWFGGKARFRREDPLLQYLYEARNDDEHGLDSSIQLHPEQFEFGVTAPNYSNTIRLDGGPFRNVVLTGATVAAAKFEGGLPPGVRITPIDRKPMLVRATPETIRLKDINARGDRILSPPTQHLGINIENTSPISISILAIRYLDQLVEEASGLS